MQNHKSAVQRNQARAKKEKGGNSMATSLRERAGLQQEADPSVFAETAAPIEEEIALRAYEIYLERGKTDGNDLDDWLQAESELRA